MDTSDPPADDWLTPRQAADLIGITPDTIRKWARDGVLPSQRVRAGSHRRFRHSDVVALIQSGESTAAAS